MKGDIQRVPRLPKQSRETFVQIFQQIFIQLCVWRGIGALHDAIANQTAIIEEGVERLIVDVPPTGIIDTVQIAQGFERQIECAIQPLS